MLSEVPGQLFVTFITCVERMASNLLLSFLQEQLSLRTVSIEWGQ